MRISDWSSDVCSSDLYSDSLSLRLPYSVKLATECKSLTHYTKGTQSPHRSEEHTSELQSLMRISYAVFCLKKKKKIKNKYIHYQIDIRKMKVETNKTTQYHTQNTNTLITTRYT